MSSNVLESFPVSFLVLSARVPVLALSRSADRQGHYATVYVCQAATHVLCPSHIAQADKDACA